MWGCRPGHSAEAMAFEIALDMEGVAFKNDDTHAGGISYDFKKAFDLIPVETMLRVLEARGLPQRLLKPMGAMYEGLRRCFRYRGTIGEWFKSYNGILQGDALAMIGLNSLASVILEATNKLGIKEATARSYADDISIVAVGKKEEVRASIRQFNMVVKAYEGARCGEINTKKTFTFGDPCAKHTVADDMEHLQQFKIVGGSLVARDNTSKQTEVEKERLEKWKATAGRIRMVPVSWKRRAIMLQATQSQAVYGQGTHGIANDLAELKKVRTTVMQALWKTECYSMSPLVTFALLTRIQLDPEFGVLYEGMRVVIRARRRPGIAETIRARMIAEPNRVRDGPMLRLKTLIKTSPCTDAIQAILRKDTLTPEMENEYLHDMRESWRDCLMRKVATDRSHQYAGAERYDRGTTMAYHDKLEQFANEECDPEVCNYNEWAAEQNSEDCQNSSVETVTARIRLAVLRRIIAGGLLTSERVARHKRSDASKKCSCGNGEATVEHVSWACPRYDEKRRNLLSTLPAMQKWQPCTRYAAIFTDSPIFSKQQAEDMQAFLVDVWQDQISRWHKGDDVQDVLNKANTAQQSSSSKTINENGHVIENRADADGVWCRKDAKGRWCPVNRFIEQRARPKQCQTAVDHPKHDSQRLEEVSRY